MIPAVDLREGHCVQLVGGEYADERVRLPDPVEQARKWERLGAPMLHVVDLDRATGRGSNMDVVRGILDALAIPVQVGGGVRDTGDVEALLEAGAARVVAGTRAIRDPRWAREVAAAHPGRLVVAVDARGRDILVRGWQEGSGVDLHEYAAGLAAAPLGGVLYTDVAREGRLEGANVDGVAELAKQTRIPVIASGGVASDADLDALAAAGAAGVVVGMAAYTGRIDMEKAFARFGGD